MNDAQPDESESYLSEICKEILALEKRQKGNLDGPEYLATWRRLHHLKEQYKQRTGVYPIVPSSS